ncbi:hypothetical protein HY994_06280 [Candidatus Micrarchaeota archaeon]|nr:hypothetical protein [Candidatus Micrarchaeota archaeon]
MDLASWRLEYKTGWDDQFHGFDNSVRIQILKKLQQMKQPLSGRGLHGSHFLVEEVGQYRIAFEQDRDARIKFIHFIGTHKQYEEWYRNQMI